METRFHTHLKKRIEETIEARAGSIASGACLDYPAYRQQVGYVEGLMAALELCNDVEKDFQ